MSESAYLVTAAPNGLRRLETRLRDQLSDYGASLVPISSRRAIVTARTALQAAEAHESRTFADLLRKWRVQEVRPISPAEVAELLRWRNPEEFTLERPAANQSLVDAGYDWHITRTRLVEAWQLLGGPDGIDWDGVKVGQIDTGYTEHPALGWANGRSPCVLTDQDRNVFYREIYGEHPPGPGVNTNPQSALDPLTGPNYGHGTRTASILAAFDERSDAKRTPGDNSQTVQGFYGAAPKVLHIPVRLSNSVLITDVAGEGLRDALIHLMEKGCQVITMSMGATFPSVLPRQTRQAIDQLYEAGIILCCAAGNYVDSVVAPARNPRTIAVGGSTPADLPWDKSSFGAAVDICAPSWPIRRADTRRRNRFTYGYGDGTSFATPQVAGTAAMWLVRYRDQLENHYPGWKRVAAFLKILKQTARIPPHGWDMTLYGSGILDALAVLTAPLPDSITLVKDERPHPLKWI